MKISLKVPVDASGERLDVWLAAQPETPSRSQVRLAIKQGAVRVDEEAARASLKLKGGETIVLVWEEVSPDDEGSGEVEAENIPLEFLHVDEDFVVVNKPAGLVVHPAVGHRTGTLVNAMAYHFGTMAWPKFGNRAGIVHRLDRDTSGAIVVARNVKTHEALAKQFQDRTVSKVYRALVIGRVIGNGKIDAPIGRHSTDRKRMSTTANPSRDALTHYEPEERLGPFTMIAAKPVTGRTHQIRVHLASRGWPVVGDPVYGSKGGASKAWKQAGAPDSVSTRLLADFDRQALHAGRLAFDHPRSGKRMEFEAPLAADFSDLLAALRSAVPKANTG